MANLQLTWLGHGSFRFDTPGGKRVYVDPWLENPKCPDGEKTPERVDLIALTHGHSDHVGDTVELHKRLGCPVIDVTELSVEETAVRAVRLVERRSHELHANPS